MTISVDAIEEFFPTQRFQYIVTDRNSVATVYKFVDGSYLYDFNSDTRVATDENMKTKATRKWGKVEMI